MTPDPEATSLPPAGARPARGPARRRRGRGLLIAALALAALLAATLLPLQIRLRALLERRAAGPSWAYPSRVYADGLALVEGRPMPAAYLVAHLTARGYRETNGTPRAVGTWSRSGDSYEILLRGFSDAPDPAGAGGPERVRLRLERGRLTAMRRLGGLPGEAPPDTAHAPRLEPVLIAQVFDSTHVRRTWVPLARMPRALQEAVIASEDRRFRRHGGLDLRSNLRALLTNVQAGGVRQGGSTITQQLARGMFLGRERTVTRKLAEATLAVGIELLLPKDRILEAYLNSVYWGQGDGGGVAGAAEAARWYFDTPVESLTVEQAATLAGLIPAPNAFSPFRNPRAALERRNAVLAAMTETGRLTAQRAAALRTRPLGARRGPAPVERFPSFSGYVRDELGRTLPRGLAAYGGLAVFTTLDLVWQATAESTLASEVAAAESRLGVPRRQLQGAFVALDPADGAVRALVGGRDPQSGDFNRATQALRQPGSAIKPVVYAAALDPGRGSPAFTPASTVPDLRRSFATPQGPWTPRNDHEEYHPQVTLAKALAKSLNVATANLVEAIAPRTVARYGERFGLGRMKPVASIGLGSNEVTLLGLTDAYATFPGRGLRAAPRPLRAIVDARGRDVLPPAPAPVRVLPRETADLMTGLLEDVVIFGIAYPLRAEFGFTRPVAGKTGTTNDFNDGWFVGFTPDLVAGVWVGCDTPRTLGLPAASTALPVWARVVTPLLEGFPATPFPADSGLALAWIDPWTGGLGGPSCPKLMRVPFLPGTQPTRPCLGPHVAIPDTTDTPPDSLAADSAATSL